jgi:hypothetical protein
MFSGALGGIGMMIGMESICNRITTGPYFVSYDKTFLYVA